jgi:hypothetical protein
VGDRTRGEREEEGEEYRGEREKMRDGSTARAVGEDRMGWEEMEE